MSTSPQVALAVTGSIAAYKAVLVARRLLEEGIRVVPVMSAGASKFLAPLTLSGICGVPVVTDMFDERYPGEVHVELGKSVAAVVIAPATADVIARLAEGRADDIVAALALCAEAPVLVAPAMHSRMWNHPATQRNVAALRADGRVTFVGPVLGPLASGESGLGRMADPDAIARAAMLLIEKKRDLAGLRVVVTAGPTVEDIDPVRFVSNRSSGKMGFAVAERAAARGASVTLVAGPVELEAPPGVRRVDVRGARQMKSAVDAALGANFADADALVMSAAVADYAPKETLAHKMKKAGDSISLELTKNPDILAEIGAARAAERPILVGFAVETADDDDVLVAYAQKKLRDKRADLVVANRATDSFGADTNRATFVTADAVTALSIMSKTDLADQILDRVRELCQKRGILPC
jgi:phosphopantothenoylcysteine decarboxylase/phosphopantothenate--cysteine ligase